MANNQLRIIHDDLQVVLVRWAYANAMVHVSMTFVLLCGKHIGVLAWYIDLAE